LETLISYLDGLNVAKAIVLPTYSWNVTITMPTEYVLEACGKYPDRLIPFCAVEVREQFFEEKVLRYVDMGCKGFGEHTSKIPVDQQLNLRLYRICGRLEIPILMHIAIAPSDAYGVTDSPDLKGLESVVKEYSNVDFIMHGPGWWRHMSAHVPPNVDYPEGPVEKPGRAIYLLENCPNIYGDLSAGSGYNAIARDLAFGKKFLEKLNRKTLYGTDLEGFFTPEHPHIKLLENLNLAVEAYENIYHRNLEKLVKT
jgi:predicted TIM-barrel fold metal-dependent hydrolase